MLVLFDCDGTLFVDTLRDIESATEHGLAVVAVDFDGEPPRNSDHAEDVVGSMPELVEPLEQLDNR